MGNKNGIDAKLKQLLATTPNMMVDSRGMLEFTCFLCKPRIDFPDLDGHQDHCLEIHNNVISYKNLLMVYLGSEQSKMMGLEGRTEQEIIGLIKRFDTSKARRSQ